jgi:hypothetical protein
MSDLAAAVMFSYAALEGLGNHTIAQMEHDAIVEVERDGEALAVSRDSMERMLSLPEKLSVVVPAFTEKPSIRCGVLWGKLIRICRLHDGLVRPIDGDSDAIREDGRRSRPDPNEPGIFGLFLRGDADACAEDAIVLVSALRPEFLPPDLIW